MNDDEEYEDPNADANTNALFGVNSFMAQFGPNNNAVTSDPFGLSALNNDYDVGKPDDAFRTTLFDPQENQALKHATVSKYFNMRQLKSRLLQKVTKAQLKRVKLVNLRQLLKNQAQALLKKQSKRLTEIKRIGRIG